MSRCTVKMLAGAETVIVPFTVIGGFREVTSIVILKDGLYEAFGFAEPGDADDNDADDDDLVKADLTHERLASIVSTIEAVTIDNVNKVSLDYAVDDTWTAKSGTLTRVRISSSTGESITLDREGAAYPISMRLFGDGPATT